MKEVIIRIKDNPQDKDLSKLLPKLKQVFLDFGIITTIETK